MAHERRRDDGALYLLGVCRDYIAAQRQLLTALTEASVPPARLSGAGAALDQAEAAVTHALHDLHKVAP